MLWRRIEVFMMIFALCQSSSIGTATKAASSSTERAIWSANAIVDPGTRSAFLAEVTKFADRQAFAIQIGQPRGDGVHFLVQMWRDDVNIIIINPFDDPTQFNCFFYQAGTQPVPDELVDALSKHLRGELGLVPGVAFKDKN